MESKNNINKILKQMELKIEEINPKTLNLIYEAEEQMMKIVSEREESLISFNKEAIDVKSISEKLGISRQAVYRNHADLVKFINFRSEYYESMFNSKLKTILNEKNEDKIMIENLLKRDVDYMELKTKVIEQEKQIKLLQQKIKENNKILNDKIYTNKFN